MKRTLLISLGLLALSSAALANNINLYEQPNSIAKVVGTIDPSSGVIPIFTPKNSEWMKVGDPSNGNVGWVKASDISGGSSTSFSFTQKVIKSGKEPQSYTFKFGNLPESSSNKQMQDMMRKMQEQQAGIQQSAQKIMQEMIDNINKLYKQQPELLHNNGGIPVIMPIVIVPASALKNPPPTKK